VFLPVVWWDAGHGWASFARQGGRIGLWQPANAIRFLAELIGGQVGLVTPLVFAFFAGGIIESVRQAWRTRDPAWTLLAALTLPAVALFTEHALGDRVQGNWPAVIYPAAAVAAGGLRAPPWGRLMPPAIALGLGITLLVYLQASVPLLPANIDPIARQLAGWDAFAVEVEAARRQTGAGFVAADQYGVAAELARTLPNGVSVIGVDARWGQTDFPRAVVAGQVGILVSSAARHDSEGLTEIGAVARRRGDATIEVLRLYRVGEASRFATAVVLPRP